MKDLASLSFVKAQQMKYCHQLKTTLLDSETKSNLVILECWFFKCALFFKTLTKAFPILLF
jgi:hypothetical protein